MPPLRQGHDEMVTDLLAAIGVRFGLLCVCVSVCVLIHKAAAL